MQLIAFATARLRKALSAERPTTARRKGQLRC